MFREYGRLVDKYYRSQRQFERLFKGHIGIPARFKGELINNAFLKELLKIQNKTAAIECYYEIVRMYLRKTGKIKAKLLKNIAAAYQMANLEGETNDGGFDLFRKIDF